MKDVYLIPVAKGIFGKLLLAEKLSLDSDEGVVIAVAPLAGLSVSCFLWWHLVYNINAAHLLQIYSLITSVVSHIFHAKQDWSLHTDFHVSAFVCN